LEIQRELADCRSEVFLEQNNARNADRARVAELECELAEARGAISSLEASLQKNSPDRARLVELEQELADAVGAEDKHCRQHQQHRARIAELEQQVGEAHA